jgi:hypothetical protein
MRGSEGVVKINNACSEASWTKTVPGDYVNVTCEG